MSLEALADLPLRCLASKGRKGIQGLLLGSHCPGVFWLKGVTLSRKWVMGVNFIYLIPFLGAFHLGEWCWRLTPSGTGGGTCRYPNQQSNPSILGKVPFSNKEILGVFASWWGEFKNIKRAPVFPLIEWVARMGKDTRIVCCTPMWSVTSSFGLLTHFTEPQIKISNLCLPKKN